MKYTTPNFDVEVVEANDIICGSEIEEIKVTTNSGEKVIGTIQSNKDNGTLNVTIPSVGDAFL